MGEGNNVRRILLFAVGVESLIFGRAKIIILQYVKPSYKQKRRKLMGCMTYLNIISLILNLPSTMQLDSFIAESFVQVEVAM